MATVFHLLTQVEKVSDSGVLVYEQPDGNSAGGIVVADGRVCLVRGVQGPPRFTDVLASKHPDCSRLLSQAVRRARLEGRLIGEVMAEMQDLPISPIRMCLREQVAACLVALAETADTARPPRWGALRGSFDTRLTFTPVEMFAAAACKLDEASQADFALEVYQRFREQVPFSVLAVRGRRSVLPICTHGFEVEDLDALRWMGRYMQGLGMPATLSAAGVEPTFVCFGDRETYGAVCCGPVHMVLLGGMDAALRARVMSEVVSRTRTTG